jgi:hypothetical protein
MDSDVLEPGCGGFAQIRLEAQLAPRYDDRFIVRSYSPVYTIGGGVVLDTLPPRRTALKQHERALLEALLAHDLSSASVGLLASRGLPMTSAEVAAALGVPRSQVADELNRADLSRVKIGTETAYVTLEALDRFVGLIEHELLSFHEQEPRATGIATSALRDRIDRRLTPKAFDALLETAVAKGIAVTEKGQVRHPKASAAAMDAEATPRSGSWRRSRPRACRPDGRGDGTESTSPCAKARALGVARGHACRAMRFRRLPSRSQAAPSFLEAHPQPPLARRSA